MKDIRIGFDEAVTRFREFLCSQDWSDDILWLTRSRISGYRRTYWIFRPEQMTSDDESKRFYDHIRQGPGSIRIDAIGKSGDKTIAYVHDWGGNSCLLNYGSI